MTTRLSRRPICPRCNSYLRPEINHDTRPPRHSDGVYQLTAWTCRNCPDVILHDLKKET